MNISLFFNLFVILTTLYYFLVIHYIIKINIEELKYIILLNIINNLISLYSLEKKILNYFSLQIVLMFTVSSFLKTFIEALEYNFTEMQKSPLENASLNQKHQTLGSNDIAIALVQVEEIEEKYKEEKYNELIVVVKWVIGMEVLAYTMGLSAGTCYGAFAASLAGGVTAPLGWVVCATVILVSAYTIYQLFDSRPVYKAINLEEVTTILNETKTLFCDEKNKGKTNPSDKEIRTIFLDDFYEVNNLRNNTFSIDKYLIFLYFLKFYKKEFEFRDDKIFFTNNKNEKQSIFIEPTIKNGEIYPVADMIYFYIFAYEHEELRPTINEILKEKIYKKDINTIIEEIKKSKQNTDVCKQPKYTTKFKYQVDVYIFHQLTDIPKPFAIEDYIKSNTDSEKNANTKISLENYKKLLANETKNLPAFEDATTGL